MESSVQESDNKHAQAVPASEAGAADNGQDGEVIRDPTVEVLAPYKTSAELQALLHQARDLFQQDKIFQACRVLDTFKQAVFVAVQTHQPIHLAAEPLDTSDHADPCSPKDDEKENVNEGVSEGEKEAEKEREAKKEGDETQEHEKPQPESEMVKDEEDAPKNEETGEVVKGEEAEKAPKSEESEVVKAEEDKKDESKNEEEAAKDNEHEQEKSEGDDKGSDDSQGLKDAAAKAKALEADIDPLCAKVEAVAVSASEETSCEEKHHDHQQEAERVWKVLLQCSPWIAKAYEEGQEVRDVLSVLHDDKGWTPVADSDGIKTMYRTEPGTTIHSVKVHSIIESPVENLIAICNEVDLLPTFLTMVKIEAASLCQVSPLSKVVYLKVHLPWPLDNRDIVAFAKGVDLMEQGDIVLVGKNCDYWPGVKIPKVASGVTRLDVHLSGAVFRPLSRTRTKVSVVFNVDFKLAIMPTMLINFFTRKLTHLGFAMFRKQCAKVPNLPAYQQRRLETNKEWYDRIHARIEAYFAQAKLDDDSTASSSGSEAEQKQQPDSKSKA